MLALIAVGMRLARQSFFDRAAVMSYLDKKTLRAFSKFGAYVRTNAARRIRKRKRPSRAGESPTNQTGWLRRWIMFFYDASRRSVVIGPLRTNQRNVTASDGTPAPGVLEHGGDLKIVEIQKFPGGPWSRIDARSRRRNAGKPIRNRLAKVAARPFMQPAFDQERTKLAQLWN